MERLRTLFGGDGIFRGRASSVGVSGQIGVRRGSPPRTLFLSTEPTEGALVRKKQCAKTTF